RGWLPADLGAGVRAAFTFHGFDLAQEAGRDALAAAWGTPLVFATQVHGARLEWVSPPTAGDTWEPAATGPGDVLAQTRAWPTCDALGTGTDGIGLVIRTADCVPVLLADPAARLVAAVHVGWRGLLAGVVEGAVADLRERGARDLRAALGPAICGRCYQVGEDLAERARAGGHVTGRGADGSPRLDVGASAERQLASRGVTVAARIRECTAESNRLFSWRARRDAGRQGAVIALAAP
ncbi:MAG: polyphenol oxidase family protein, partial [Bifidobacteriaceae bacterium]|nr:polyphenol oxidase family protein [Bifidobacteriaceae bacterium]